MMNCKQATRLLSDQLERPLGRGERLSLKFHLMMCRACRNFGRQMGTLRSLSRGYAKTDAQSSTESESPGRAGGSEDLGNRGDP